MCQLRNNGHCNAICQRQNGWILERKAGKSFIPNVALTRICRIENSYGPRIVPSIVSILNGPPLEITNKVTGCALHLAHRSFERGAKVRKRFLKPNHHHLYQTFWSVFFQASLFRRCSGRDESVIHSIRTRCTIKLIPKPRPSRRSSDIKRLSQNRIIQQTVLSQSFWNHDSWRRS